MDKDRIAPQTMSLTKVDPQSVATGYRVSKILGSSVVNESGDTVGNIDDLIITSDDKVPFAVLSVGGFLGMGTKHVVVSFGELQTRDNEMMLRGASSESLKNLPGFAYNEKQRTQGTLPGPNTGTEKRPLQ